MTQLLRGLLLVAACTCSAVQAAVGQVGRKDPQVPTAHSASAEPSSIGIIVGYGPSQSDWFERLYNFGSGGYGTLQRDLHGLTISARMLLRTGIAPSRLRLGGEVGIFTVKAGVSGGTESGNVCYNCYSQTDDAGIHLNALASLRVATMGRVTLRLETGGGVVFFNLNPAGEAQDKNNEIAAATGTPYYTSAPGPEPIASARVVPAIRLGGANARAAVTVDPYVSVLRTFGETRTTSISVGLGIGVQWGAVRR